jgi:hypothetical protein
VSLAETYVVVLWPSSRAREEEILRDLADAFEVRAIVDLTWSAELFAQNLVRFYGKPLPPRYDDKAVAGTHGAMRVIVVRDPHPSYEYRPKSSGPTLVNKNVFDRKQRYRAWVGGGYRVHSSESAGETLHDLSLLLGPDHERYLTGSSAVQTLARDLPGARGWTSLDEVFTTLNGAMPYVVLADASGRYGLPVDGDGGVIELCVPSRQKARYLLDLTPLGASPREARMSATVAAREVRVDLREPGDDAFDPHWQANMLESRHLGGDGRYRPDLENRFYAGLYRLLVRRGLARPSGGGGSARADLSALAERLRLDLRWDAAAGSPGSPEALLASFMRARGYLMRRPKDHALAYAPTRDLHALVPTPGGRRRRAVRDAVGNALARLGVLAGARRLRRPLKQRAT